MVSCAGEIMVENPWLNIVEGPQKFHGDTYGHGEYWIDGRYYCVKRPSMFVAGLGSYGTDTRPIPARVFDDESPTWLTVYSYKTGVRKLEPEKTWRLDYVPVKTNIGQFSYAPPEQRNKLVRGRIIARNVVSGETIRLFTSDLEAY
jgi:hypothetical protein